VRDAPPDASELTCPLPCKKLVYGRKGVHNGSHASLERMPKVSKETFNLARYLSRLRRSVEGQDDGLCPVEGRG
jgi:hypothetical protein